MFNGFLQCLRCILIGDLNSVGQSIVFDVLCNNFHGILWIIVGNEFGYFGCAWHFICVSNASKTGCGQGVQYFKVTFDNPFELFGPIPQFVFNVSVQHEYTSEWIKFKTRGWELVKQHFSRMSTWCLDWIPALGCRKRSLAKKNLRFFHAVVDIRWPIDCFPSFFFGSKTDYFRIDVFKRMSFRKLLFMKEKKLKKLFGKLFKH